MPKSLEEWQDRLAGHFEKLAAARTASGYPVFALEHGLNDEEVARLSNDLRDSLKEGHRLSRYWLPWVVYATERGYSYEGDEYWRSFEEQTPFWEGANRYSLARCFRRFLTIYGGMEPTGPWAEHFRIIALPITHAILPKYLQIQFAKLLYDLRYQIARLHETDAASIGRLLSSYGFYTSTRFQEFLQQEELTGRIVLGLLHTERGEGTGPIYPATLERIVADLETVRSAREWLKEARRAVRDRITGLGRRSQVAGPAANDSQPRKGQHPEIRPNLYLRSMGTSNWSVAIEFPSFRGIAALNPDIRKFLQATRCRLNGADDFKPRGWLLSGAQRGAIKRWPDVSRPLIEFEATNALLDHFLAAECRIHDGPFWLFRIGRDGLGREISGKIVRPGRDYVIVGSTDFPQAPAFTSQCQLECEHVRAIRVSVPSEVTADHIEWFNKLGIQVARTIRVWPAGLPGRGWNGEGTSEWLTTETPCIGITHDHPIASYELLLSDGSRAIIEAGPVGYPTFVQLPELRAGTHELRVKALKSERLNDIASTPQAEGTLELRVREPQPWVPGTSFHSGLVVTAEPFDPDLSMFWENQVEIEVKGPEGHQVVCEVTLENARGEEILSDVVSEYFDLPITPKVWQSRFAKFIQEGDREWRYLEAASCTLIVRGEELGEYKLTFEHVIRPVRWVARQVEGSAMLRLIDDTDSEDSSPTCFMISMEKPASPDHLDPARAIKGFQVAPPGALFTAQHGDHKSVLAVSTGLARGGGFQALNVVPNVDAVSSGKVAPSDALLYASIWNDAKIAGPLSEIRRFTVVDSIIRAVVAVFGGESWLDIERRYIANPERTEEQELLKRYVFKRGGFAAVLARDYYKASGGTPHGRDWYRDVAKRFDICRKPELSAFAYDFAFNPETIIDRYGKKKCDSLLEDLKNFGALFRGARLLALRSKHGDEQVLERPRRGV